MQNEIVFAHNPFSELTEVRASALHGWGVFARRLIPKGTVWWQARSQDVLVIERDQYEAIDSLPRTVLVNGLLDAILHYSYYPSGLNRLILILDGAQFTNHSFTPNSVDDPTKLQSLALHDIGPGAEILEDYSHYGKCPWAPLYGEFAKAIWERN
ncbi:MAG: SET domain-containing protein [Mesorhizobium sp.]|uniref:SET domain-containing protein-lysine N-methyltransferase n=1 Tax=unclassified Mesorhizobium TaxID=325217 RepID=UPI000FE34388|nr:SET domain-containing protein-lysine N-methyltransferase [Mesorhizobium sp.]RWC03488.1 MAG: SET domain-containing protein [Mesorhizobium sp.]RWH82637.1 MAG: SET domain-containing protein [Mesorhizobium sp.]RWH87440.1 MAG: SET domain-containing protein [Mesorhizobium sp.]RWH93016.1 MAG: SET domain-containing protein [Mesorhizobium sp.]RWH99115.1 MAG: SET domain-containing protein [Mesorhizobium sp.]